MTVGEREKQLKRKLFLLVPAAFLALVLGILIYRRIPTKKHMDPAAFFGAGEGSCAIVADGVLSETRGLVRDGALYLDSASVSALITPAVFYDAAEEKLIVTTAREKTVYAADGAAGGDVIFENGAAYIRSDVLTEKADVLIRREEAPDRAVAVTEFTPVRMTFAKDAPVRLRAGIKSPIVADVPEGTAVRVTDRLPDGSDAETKVRGWTHVVTEDGFFGYVKDDCLADPRTEEIAEKKQAAAYTRTRLAAPVNLIFHQTDSAASNAALQESLRGVDGPNVIAPTWFYLEDTEGGVRSLADEDYVRTAHEAGLSVYAVLNDFDGNIASAGETAEALGTDSRRSRIVRAVTDDTVSCGADGLVIDIELVRKETAPDFLELIREFSVEMRNAGKTLAVCDYVPAFTGYLNRAEQARVADYVIVMCYDEHTAGSEKAGPVASLPFVEKGLRDTIAAVGEEGTIAAIPFFSRLWETKEGGKPSSRAYGMRTAREKAEELGLQVSYDEAAAQNYAEGKSGDADYAIWLEDAVSVEEKMKVIEASGCAGVAAWKLGLETSDIWGVISKHLPS